MHQAAANARFVVPGSARSEFEGRSRNMVPKCLQSASLPSPSRTVRPSPQSWGKLRREPATRQLDESFAPTPGCDERFARQHHCDRPPMFPQASTCPGIVRRLSGRSPHTPTHGLRERSTAVPGEGTLDGRRCRGCCFHCALSTPERYGVSQSPEGLRAHCTPWSVFQDG